MELPAIILALVALMPLAIYWLAWELIKDRILGYVNKWFDRKLGDRPKEAISWLVERPIRWALVFYGVYLATLLVIFIRVSNAGEALGISSSPTGTPQPTTYLATATVSLVRSATSVPTVSSTQTLTVTPTPTPTATQTSTPTATHTPALTDEEQVAHLVSQYYARIEADDLQGAYDLLHPALQDSPGFDPYDDWKAAVSKVEYEFVGEYPTNVEVRGNQAQVDFVVRWEPDESLPTVRNQTFCLTYRVLEDEWLIRHIHFVFSDCFGLMNP